MQLSFWSGFSLAILFCRSSVIFLTSGLLVRVIEPFSMPPLGSRIFAGPEGVSLVTSPLLPPAAGPVSLPPPQPVSMRERAKAGSAASTSPKENRRMVLPPGWKSPASGAALTPREHFSEGINAAPARQIALTVPHSAGFRGIWPRLVVSPALMVIFLPLLVGLVSPMPQP